MTAARLSGRLARLERAAGVRGTCPECAGQGGPSFEVWMDGERQHPEPRGCGGCGRRGLVYRVSIDGPDEAPVRPGVGNAR